MTTTQLIALITVLSPPIIAGVVGAISSRTGIPGKIKEIEYYLKKLELINQLSAYREKHDASDENKFNWASIDREISDILSFIQESTVEKTDVKSLIEEQNTGKLSRIFILPKPISAGGWVATIIYYLYGFSTLMYLTFLFFPPSYTDAAFNSFIPAGIIGGFILTLLGRYFALRSWKNKSKQLKNSGKKA